MAFFYETSQPLFLQPLLFNDLDDATDYGISPDVDVHIKNQVVDELEPHSRRLKRSAYSPYGYGYSYYGPRGYGSGYGSGASYGGGCYNCGYRPGRALRAGLVVGGAAFAGGFIGSRLGRRGK